MSGIAGIYAYHYAANPVDRSELQRIRDYLASRGPDGIGEWYSQDARVGLGHRRLSIIDLSERGIQPMASADGSHVLAFDGRIYNHRELRASLEALGCKFRTQTDAEVLLHLYAEKGPQMVHDLRGMFAFCLWDAQKRALLLARDPYGAKPLYYADDGWTLRFASQVKALLAGGKISRKEEPAGWVGFCLFGSVPEPYTTYQEIRAVPAGSFLWVDRIGPGLPSRYFSIAELYCKAETVKAPASDQDLLIAIREAVLDSVRLHFMSDVPVGVFLSGGIDSGALVGLMRDLGQQRLETITITFEGCRDGSEEAARAKEIASLYGTSHTTRVFTENEFQRELPDILDAMDQPTIDGLTTWFLSKAAREQGCKVAISGVGGDELFGGFPSFRDLPRWVRALAIPGGLPGLGDLARRVLSANNSGSVYSKAAGLLKLGTTFAGAYLLRRGLFMPWELEGILGAEVSRLGLRRLKPIQHIQRCLTPQPRTAFAKIAVLESSLYTRNQLLRDMDWACMAHSLELRTPLLDLKLLRQVALAVQYKRLQNKSVLANSPSVPLPSRLAGGRKEKSEYPIKWLQRDERFQRWRQVPALAADNCPWARRWAFQVVPA